MPIQLTLDQLVNLIIGPVGLTIGAIYVVYKFSTGAWVGKERLDEERRKSQELSDLLDKALGLSSEVTTSITERNKLERNRLEQKLRNPAQTRRTSTRRPPTNT